MFGQVSRNDLFAGAIFIALGLYFAVTALGYELGTLFRMGPGYMPMVLGISLALLGVVIIAAGIIEPTQDEPARRPPWRAMLLIGATILFFGLAIRGLGFVPTVFAGSLATALASRRSSLIAALAIAAGLTVLCTLVFITGLGLTVPMIGPWLPF